MSELKNGVMLIENALRCVAQDIELYYKKKAPNGAWCIATCRNAAAQFEQMRSELAELRRAQPENSRQHALQTGVCPMCEDCPDGCPVETPNDSRNRPENEPLTLDGICEALDEYRLSKTVSHFTYARDCENFRDGIEAAIVLIREMANPKRSEG